MNFLKIVNYFSTENNSLKTITAHSPDIQELFHGETWTDLVTVLVLAGIELIFFTETSTELYFGFVLDTGLII